MNMNRLKELRNEKGMTQSELADRLPIGRTSISNYEREDRQLDPDTIRKICRFFNCTSDYLLCLSDRRDPELSEADAQLLAAYHAATSEIKGNIDHMLIPYREKKEAAVG